MEGRDLPERRGVERGASHQNAVDVALAHEAVDDRRVHRAPVQNSARVGHRRIVGRPESLPDRRVDALRDVGRQMVRNRGAFGKKPDDMPVFGTSAATFNEPCFCASFAAGLVCSVATLPFETAKNRMAFQKADPATGRLPYTSMTQTIGAGAEKRTDSSPG